MSQMRRTLDVAPQLMQMMVRRSCKAAQSQTNKLSQARGQTTGPTAWRQRRWKELSEGKKAISPSPPPPQPPPPLPACTCVSLMPSHAYTISPQLPPPPARPPACPCPMPPPSSLAFTYLRVPDALTCLPACHSTLFTSLGLLPISAPPHPPSPWLEHTCVSLMPSHACRISS